MHCTSRSLLMSAFSAAFQRPSALLPPAFLAPSVSLFQNAPFSSSTVTRARKDGNLNRGVSALRRTGLGRKQRLQVKLSDLPKPVLDPRLRSAVDVDEDHGLWEFFNRDRTALSTPAELAAHGRGWTVPELRQKDWDDLWRLWWVCVKEKNRLATFMQEKERVGKLAGGGEVQSRLKEIKRTQISVRHVLTERWYAWEDARYAAMDDPEVDLSANVDAGESPYISLPKADEDQAAVEGETTHFPVGSKDRFVLPAKENSVGPETRV